MKVLFSSCIIHVCIGMIYAYSVLVNPMMDFTEWSKVFVSSVFSVIIVCLGVSASQVHKLIPHFGTQHVCSAAAIMFMVSFMVMTMALNIPSQAVMIIASILLGLSVGALYSIPVPLVMKSFQNKKAIASGLCIMSFGIGSLIASNILQYVLDKIGNLPSTVLLVGIVYGAIILVFSTQLPNTHNTNHECDSSIFKSFTFMTIFAFFFINISLGIALLSMISPMMQTMFDYSPAKAAYFVGIVGLCNGLGRLLWSFIAERTKDALGTYQVMFVIQLVALFLLGTSSSIFAYWMGILIIISVYGGGFAIMPSLLATIYEQDKLQYIFGNMLLAWGLAGIFGPITMSIAQEYCASMQHIFLYATPLIAIAIALVYANKKRRN